MKLHCVFFAALMSAACIPVCGAEPAGYETFDAARRLQQEGKLEEAFLKYLAVPGGESAARKLARRQPAEYLKKLADRSHDVAPIRRELLEGDLLLTLGRNDEALAVFRRLAAKVAKETSQEESAAATPYDVYLVEPPSNVSLHRPLQPFAFGPGSHRDNWLLRRLIALEAFEEAEKEFARVWEIHRTAAKPYLADAPQLLSSKSERRVVRPAGFDGLGLQFALDYAYFLKRRERTDDSLTVLLEPILVVDLDRNPAFPTLDAPAQDKTPEMPVLRHRVRPMHWRYSSYRASSGVSRKEFIRLAYGTFKSADQEERLVAAIQRQIDDGKASALRTMAQICFHQGRDDDALALELQYAEQGDFGPVGTAYRRGLAYENSRRNAEAALQYERALATPFKPFRKPDADEDVTSQRMQSSRPYLPTFHTTASPPAIGQVAFREEVLGRLQRLYAALGKTDESVRATLELLEVDPRRLTSFDGLKQAADRLEASGRRATFDAWARKQISRTDDENARANLFWTLGDHGPCIESLARACRTAENRWPAHATWRGRFQKAGERQFRAYLAAMHKADPQNNEIQLDLLELDGRLDGEEAIALFEDLLESGESFAFSRYGRNRGPLRFRGPCELAYRLMRLYERYEQTEKIFPLGMRILRREKPFENVGGAKPLPTPRANWNGRTGLEDLLDCAYVAMAHASQPEQRKQLAELVDASDCLPLKNQLARLLPERRGRRLDPSELRRREYAGTTVKTVGRPEGVRLLTHRDDVRAVSPDGRWIGTSWGMVRYRTLEDGTLDVLQIPTGVRTTSFLQTPAGLFVGTRKGLYRLDEPDAKEPQLVRIDLDAPRRLCDDDYKYNKNYLFWRCDLLWRNGDLWVQADSHLFRYRPETDEAQFYGQVRGKLFAAAGELFASRHVYNPETETFERLAADRERWELIGATSQEIWATAYVDDRLRHRPALFEPKTRRLRVLPLEGGAEGHEVCINGEFEILAEHGDRVWLLGNDSHRTVYDRKTGKLRQTHRSYNGSDLPDAEPAGPTVWHAYQAGGQFYGFDARTGAGRKVPGLNLDGDRGPYFCWQEQPDGSLLLGAGIVREWREDNLGFDDNTGMSHHVQDLEGGLFEIDVETLQWEKLGSRAEELTDFYVKRIYFDDRDRRAYVCTNGGVTILSLPDARIAGRITVSDGLPSNKIEDVVRIGAKLYLACELGDEDGGLAVQDLKTGLIQRLSMADGLKSDKIKRLRAEGTDLHILYGTVYGVRARNTPQDESVQAEGADSRVRTFRSSILDTKTGRLRDGDAILPAAHAPDEKSWLPYLGGAVLCDVTHAGRRWIGGTHGLVIAPKDLPLSDADRFPLHATKPVLSLRQRQLAEAADTDVPRRVTVEQLLKYLDHPNPYVKADALASAMQPVLDGDAEFAPLLSRCVKDPCLRVRSTAVWLLMQLEDASPAPLKIAARDSDPYVRAVATLAIARRGEPLSPGRLEELLEKGDRFSNYPFGRESSLGVIVDRMKIYQAAAAHADEAVFEVFMKHPPARHVDGTNQHIFKDLGASLRKRPRIAQTLLQAYDQPHFAENVFRFAGEPMLPALHKALADDDRVVRANAARACGAIGSRASIPHLIEALDLESGYSRAAIVWALGELKAEQALQHLATLYVNARNDEQRRRGSGFRMAQSIASMQAHYDTFSDLDALAVEWNELKRAAKPEPIDPRRNEELLSPAGILEAVRKIGPTASQPFYRSLAGERDAGARGEAARHLADCAAGEIDENAKILDNLLADDDVQVRMAAATSLLIFSRESAQTPVIRWLSSPNDWQKRAILQELSRANRDGRLAFARGRIRAIAADKNASRETRRAAEALREK